jgi:hypothetical protein
MPSRLADTGEYVFRQRRITAETGMFAIGDFASYFVCFSHAQMRGRAGMARWQGKNCRVFAKFGVTFTKR